MPATPLRSTLRTLCAAAIIGLPTGSWAATDDAMRDALNAARQQQCGPAVDIRGVDVRGTAHGEY